MIFPESLDAECRVLLGRAQGAIGVVLGSQVRAAGLLGNPIDDATLRQHEWEIASKLREITSLRELLAQNSRSAQAGPMTADVLAAQQRAIELAQEAGADDPEAVARELHMLITGSIIGAELGDLDSAREAKEVAGLVLERAGIAASRDPPP